jgi:hypothetical protein
VTLSFINPAGSRLVQKENVMPCNLTIEKAADIVGKCAPKAPNIDTMLPGAGFISPLGQSNFRDCVYQAVLNEGCLIQRGDVPIGDTTTLRTVMLAIKAAADALAIPAAPGGTAMP